jgi:hypothetical protein
MEERGGNVYNLDEKYRGETRRSNTGKLCKLRASIA